MNAHQENRGANDAVQLVSPECWRSAKSWYKRCTLDTLFDRGCVDFSAIDNPDAYELSVGDASEDAYQGRAFGLIRKSIHSLTFFFFRSLKDPLDRPGFVHFPQALSKEAQVDLAYLCYERYCKKPHVTNVDSHLHRPAHKQPALSWASLGYNFDWTTRTYSERRKTPFPEELAELTARFARRVQVAREGGGCGFRAETAIVNYYKSGGNMGPHVDDSEDDKVNPVVSISLGKELHALCNEAVNVIVV